MPLSIIDHGQHNEIAIDPDLMSSGNGQILITGDHNRIEIASDCTTASLSMRLGSGCSFRVGRRCGLAALEVFAFNSGFISIGAETNFTADARIYLHEAGAVALGKNCLVGPGMLVMNSDMHSITDLVTGTRINPAGDVTIGDAVWLAANVVVLKGSAIGAGSVIGYGSLVSGAIPANSLAVGSPARVLRRQVSWHPDLS